ncbi:MAG: hypothetical protein LBM17_04190 [Candidatus Accumulibacter sp.]|jgi:hypothetical protein|nr:hypothetical protein [Accumulibacter sp.]
MNENSTLQVSDSDDLDEAPVWTAEDFANAVHRVGLKPVGKKVNEKTPLQISDSDDLDEVPPLTAEDFANAVHRVGLKPVGEARRN